MGWGGSGRVCQIFCVRGVGWLMPRPRSVSLTRLSGQDVVHYVAKGAGMGLGLGSTASTDVGAGAGRGRLALLVGAAMLLVFFGYLVGIHRSGTRVVTGPAQVGDHVVTMTVDGTSYGFRDSMPWIDANNSYHEGGWPDCLGTVTTLPSVTFGVARVDYPDGNSGDQVVYVDCRS